MARLSAAAPRGPDVHANTALMLIAHITDVRDSYQTQP